MIIIDENVTNEMLMEIMLNNQVEANMELISKVNEVYEVECDIWSYNLR